MEFNFVLGAANMKKHPSLSSEGEKQLFSMHKLVVPTLEFQNDSGQYLEDKWAAGENENLQRFMAFVADNGQVKSMISGIIVDNNVLMVINTATVPELRGQGMLKNVLAQTVLHASKNFPDIDKMSAFFSMGIPASSYSHINNDILDVINKEAGAVEEITADKAKSYGKPFGEVMQALHDNAETSDLYSSINPEMGVNFIVGSKLFSEVSEFTNISSEMSVGANFNFLPCIEINEELVQYCESL